MYQAHWGLQEMPFASGLDCSRFFRSRHLDKAETSRATGHAIFYDLSRFNVTRLGKVVAQIIAGRLEREISHVEFCSHFYVCPCDVKGSAEPITEQRQESDFLSAKRDVPML